MEYIDGKPLNFTGDPIACDRIAEALAHFSQRAMLTELTMRIMQLPSFSDKCE